MLDLIQWLFTDDGQNDGRLVELSEAKQILNYAMALSMSGTNSVLSDDARLLALSRRQTTETLEKHYQYIDILSRKLPWQLKNENADWTKIARENLLVEALDPPKEKVAQIFFRCRAETEGLITILAVLRYKADKGQVPEKLDELVTTGYLKTLASDPFGDKTFTYKRTDEGFTLYSFGLNLTDDGGKAGLSPTSKQPTRWADNGDTVFWPVLR